MVYFAYIQNYAKKTWKLRIDRNFQPKLSILIPVHDEESVIESKLENIKNASYPKEKIEVLVVDDASGDKTSMKARDFMKDNPQLNIKVVRQNPRVGKSAALNRALAVSARAHA